MRKIAEGAFDDTRSNRKCGECPKYARKTRWCPVKASCRQPDARVCRYGLVLIGAAAQRGRRNRHGQGS